MLKANPAKSGPENVEGALKERLEIYRRTKVAAEDEGNTSKARRYGRICKQFEDAIKMYAHGKAVPLDELPVPPGFPPLSLNSQNNDTAAQPTSEPDTDDTVKKPVQPKAPIPPPRGKEFFSKFSSTSCLYLYLSNIIVCIRFIIYNILCKI